MNQSADDSVPSETDADVAARHQQWLADVRQQIGYHVYPIKLGAEILMKSLATLRDKRYHSEPRQTASGRKHQANGYADAFITDGATVYVDVCKYAEIQRSQSVKHEQPRAR